ncbi:MAG TPA: glycosyltransferase family 87 protein [Candidatus Binataceae bacterium]|nr:glycosyltransferase family 87 protein [Candidatus Binataceae bacterium]
MQLPARSYKSSLLNAALFTTVAIRYAVLLRALPGRATRYDFSIYYDWAVAVRRGLDPYAADLYGQGLSLGLEVPNRQAVYPPPALSVFGLLGYLPIHAAYWIWMALSAIAFALALLFDRIRIGSAAPAVVALILLSPPVTTHLWYGQSQFLILLLLVLVMRCLWRRRDELAGLALAAAILFKAFPAVIIGYMLTQRRWKAVGWTLCGLVLGEMAMISATGLKEWTEFLKSQAGAAPGVENMAVAGLIARICGQVFSAAGAAAGRAILVAGFQVSLLLATYAATLGGDDSGGGCFGLWVAAMVAASPIVWEHYLVLLIIPVVALAAAAAAGRVSRRAKLAMLAACVLVFAIHPLTLILPQSGAAAILAEYGVAVLVLVYLSAWWLVRDRAAPS